jgi:hypothetical protein
VSKQRPESPEPGSPTRESWRSGPEPDAAAVGWRALDDDDLLDWIERLPLRHSHDAELLEIVRSARHFFVRQEAAKRLENADQLKEHFDDRHVGQILARRLSRTEDAAYLEQLVRTSRHLEVRKAAEAQLGRLAETAQPANAANGDTGRRC